MNNLSRKALSCFLLSIILSSFLICINSVSAQANDNIMDDTGLGENDTKEQNENVTVENDIPKDSILRFRENSIIRFFTAPNAVKLINDMNDGKIPKECNLSFASLIGQPKVSVTDPEIITDLYNRLSRLVVVEKANWDMTDAYYHISFVLQDDTEIKYDFHGPVLWYNNKQTYEVKDEGDLWPKVRELLGMG